MTNDIENEQTAYPINNMETFKFHLGFRGRPRVGFLICNALIIFTLMGNVASNAVLHQNGYEGILVAIGEQVKENPDIITNIKRMFTEGSEILFNATRQRAYFSEVTIVVPATWSTRDEYTKTQGSGWLADADIRIDLPHPAHGPVPYTLQLGGCGEEASYTHLSEEYASGMYEEWHQIFGPPGKVLVHEWAHLRWGVFDEYGKHGTPFPAFYVGEDLEMHSTGCTAGLKGWLLTDEGKKCQADSSGLPDSNCHFFPSPRKNVNGSLMNLYFLDSVTQFCDNEDVPHNSFAPSAHNLHCDGRSTWDVITSHADFKNDSNPPRKKRSLPDITPKFDVIQEIKQKPRFVLLLDLSGSMDVYMTVFYQEVVRFVRDLIPTGSEIAVVSFANDSHLDVDFTKVTDDNREKIISKMPKNYTEGGFTAIGAALRFVLQLIDERNVESEGLMVILVTDGQETMHPLVSTVLPDVKYMGIVINTVSLGPNATNSLERWAFETGGRSYYQRPGPLSSASTLDALLLDSISKAIESNDELLQVHREVVRVDYGMNNSVNEEVFLDSSLGHLTRFTFTERISNYNSFSTSVSLASPAGERYDNTSDSSIYREDRLTRSISFTLPEAQAGIWIYTLTNIPPPYERPMADDILVAVTSYPNHKAPEDPIRVKAWMPSNNIEYPAPAPVYAHVSQGYSIVVNANVTSIIDPPTHESPITFPLFDNGVGADMQAGDGIYSAYFTQFSGNGRYSLSAVVSTTNSTAKIQGAVAGDLPSVLEAPISNAIRQVDLPIPENSLPHPADSSFHLRDLNLPDVSPGEETDRSNKNLDKVKVEPFTRFTSGGIFKVTNYQPEDMQPPGRVTDLTVLRVSLYEATVRLKWTSPGDDHYHGRASLVDLRYHDTGKILQDFNIGHRINESHLIKGDLKPLMAGMPHEITIKIERKLEELENKVVFFCVCARDEVGNRGDISNVATAFFPLREYARNIKEEQKANATTGLVVLGILAFMILMIVAFIGGVKLLHFRNKKKKRTQEFTESGYRYYYN